ncbi:hypothetical protein STENM223S_06325 [Streptomyces tendae]
MTRYAAPGTEGAIVTYASRYDHWIGGAYVPPVRGGGTFENPSPVTGGPSPRSPAAPPRTSNSPWTRHTPPRPRGS